MKLKIINIVWVVKKVHHMIETVKHTMIVYIDHFITVFIVWQFSLNTVNMKKLNLHLVCVSEYLQWFWLNIHYKSDKINIISDVLSCLVSHKYHSESDDFSLNILHSTVTSIYVNNFIKVFSDFHQQILDDYIKKSHWQCVIEMIRWNNTLNMKAAKLSYTYI